MPGEEERLKASGRRLQPGDRVRPCAGEEMEGGDPDPVGTVIVRISTGDLLVDFPDINGGMWADEDLELVEPAPPGWKPEK